MSTPIIEVEQLKKKYSGASETALKGVDFTVAQGEVFSLLGPNGAGKTTMISILTGLLQPSAGDARLCGHSVVSQSLLVKKNIGVVPQEIALYPFLSVLQNLTFFGRIYGLSGQKLKDSINRALRRVNLTDRGNDKVNNLSGGMQRRLNIAVALLHDPQILFMDEPTVGIDPQNRRYIMDTIKSLNNNGMTIFYTSHYMEEVQEISDRIGVIDHGEIVAMGTQQELLAQIEQLHTVSFAVDNVDDSVGLLALLQSDGNIEQIVERDGQLQLTTEKPNEVLIPMMSHLNRVGASLSALNIESPNLETVFLTLTGHKLRD